MTYGKIKVFYVVLGHPVRVCSPHREYLTQVREVRNGVEGATRWVVSPFNNLPRVFWVRVLIERGEVKYEYIPEGDESHTIRNYP
jgi:hypothetical protein